MTQQDEEIAAILLEMIKQVPVSAISEGLMVEALLSIEFDLLPHPEQFWNTVAHKCLEVKDESRIMLLETVMKESKCC